MSRKTDPIKRIELADGRARYRFVVDVGRKADGRRDQRTFTFNSLREARCERARIITETAAGTYVKPNRKLTVAEYLSEWIRDRDVKPSTARFYQDALRPVRRAATAGARRAPSERAAPRHAVRRTAPTRPAR